jgi:hypothetical protein
MNVEAIVAVALVEKRISVVFGTLDSQSQLRECFAANDDFLDRVGSSRIGGCVPLTLGCGLEDERCAQRGEQFRRAAGDYA